jgi:hypothetical protein
MPAAAPDVWHIAEGNGALSARLLQASGAGLLQGYRVTAVTRLPDGRYQLQCQQQLAGPSGTAQVQQPVQVQEYDAVIIAAPLEQANISFAGLQLPHMPARKFQQTVTTYVQGVLDPAYFGLPGPAMPAGDVLASNDATMPWTVVGDKGPAECGSAQQQGQAQGQAGGSAAADDGAEQEQEGQQQGQQQKEEVQASRRLQAAQQQQRQQPQPQEVCSLAGGPQARLYKLFSSAPLQPEELSRLFRSHQVGGAGWAG